MTDSGLILPFGDDGSNVSKNNGVDVLPSEEEAINQCIVDEKNSLQCHEEFSSVDDVDSLMRAVRGFASRLRQRISEVGFVAVVSTDLTDPENFDMYDGLGDTRIEWHPRVDIVARTSGQSDIDEEKRGYEVRHGLADGRVGRLRGGREWDDDPDSRLIL